jgi:hypothetical protein
MSEKGTTPIYVGSGVEKFNGNLIEISVCLSDLAIEHKFEYNGKSYIKLKVSKKKEADQYGKTHSVAINQYKPPVKEDY